MKINKKSQVAVCSMIDIALKGPGKLVRLEDLAKRRSLSVSYLEQMFAKLRNAGLVESVRGPGGGYRIADIDSVSVADIVTAITGVEQSKSRNEVNKKWVDISKRIQTSLHEIKLRDLIV